jgi:chromosome segregation ATPase
LPAACFNQYNVAVSPPSPDSSDSDTVAELDARLRDLQRALDIRGAEVEDAYRHIAGLEEKLLKLKEYRRELKLLREETRRLRKSAERRVGQVLLAPYRLSTRLAKTVWRRFDGDARVI